MKLSENKNRELARELYNLTDKWVQTFNFIDVSILEKVSDNMLFEYIRQPEPDYEEFVNNYDLHSELLEYIQEHFNGVNENIDLFKDEAFEETIQAFCEEEQQNNFEDWRSEQEGENYPMWNTCFEFKHDESEEVIQAAEKAGFGIIEDLDDFNTILFVSGAGYSFYGAHWIPLFLSLPWNSDLREKYKDVNYSMM
ncbi:MAG: hypothetical protein ACQERX_06240 [Bacillota bacterium]